MTQMIDKKALPPIKLAAHRVWVAEKKKTLPDGVTLAYLLVTTPSGGASYHPVARLPRELAVALPEHDARLFVERPAKGYKPLYEEITLEGNTFDWEKGTVVLPVTLEPNPEDTFPGKRKGKGGLVPISTGGEPGAAVPEEIDEPTEEHEDEPEVEAADEEAPAEPAPEPTPDPEPPQEAPETPQEDTKPPAPVLDPSEAEIGRQEANPAAEDGSTTAKVEPEPGPEPAGVPENPEATPKDELPIPAAEGGGLHPEQGLDGEFETPPKPEAPLDDATAELPAATPEATPPAAPETPAKTLFKKVDAKGRAKYVELAPGEKHKGQVFEKVGTGKATRYAEVKKGK